MELIISTTDRDCKVFNQMLDDIDLMFSKETKEMGKELDTHIDFYTGFFLKRMYL